MIELEKNEYPLLKKLFPDDHPFVEVPMIVNGGRGRAWVDEKENPDLGLITMGVMIFIEGDGNPELLRPIFPKFAEIPSEVNCDMRLRDVIAESFAKVIETVNIFFDHDGQCREFTVPHGVDLVEVDENLFRRLNETGENWLGSMYYDEHDFVRNGYGFAVMANNHLCSASVAFSIDGHRANIGIGTAEAYRNRGYSTLCTSACVIRSLEMGIKPVWITGPDNIASQTVALKNGFRPSFELPCLWVGD